MILLLPILMVRKIIAEHGLQRMLVVIQQHARNAYTRMLLVRRCSADSPRDSGVMQVEEIAMSKQQLRF